MRVFGRCEPGSVALDLLPAFVAAMGGANGDGNGNAAGGKAAGSKAQAAAATAQKRAAAGEEVALGDAKQAKQQKVADQQRKSDAPASAVSDAGVRVERLSYPVQLSAVYDESYDPSAFPDPSQTLHKIDRNIDRSSCYGDYYERRYSDVFARERRHAKLSDAQSSKAHYATLHFDPSP